MPPGYKRKIILAFELTFDFEMVVITTEGTDAMLLCMIYSHARTKVTKECCMGLPAKENL